MHHRVVDTSVMRYTSGYAMTNEMEDDSGCSRLGLEPTGGLILQLLAEIDQLLLKCQEPVTDGIWQVAVVHGGIG